MFCGYAEQCYGEEMTLRIRCQVLRLIAINDGATSETVAAMLPDLEPKQVQKAIYQLLTQDRIFKTGQEERKGSVGRARFIYVANEDWEPANAKAKVIKKAAKIGRKSHSEELQTNGGGFSGVIRFRDRKVRLLLGVTDRVSGAQKDLIIGMLADYGHKYNESRK